MLVSDIINKIYLGHSELIAKDFPNNFVDLIVTSPPYKDKDGYNPITLNLLFEECYRILKPKGLMFINFGHLAEDKLRPFYVCECATYKGFKLNDTIVWIKNHYKPIQGSKRLNNLTEFIFMLYKGRMPKIDRLSIGVPYEDKSNIGRYADKDLKCGGNVWYVNYETITKAEQKEHPDRFPKELPERCIKLSNIPKGSIVLDPFSGSGTTLLAARDLGMNYIGIELLEKHVNYSIKKLNT